MQNAAAKIEMELAPGERLLWAGQPKQGLQLRTADFIVIPFSLCFLGFSIFWELMVLRIPNSGQPTNWIFMLFGLPFLAAGLYLFAGRFFWEARRRQRTFYGITNRRVIIFWDLRSRQVRSIDLAQISDIQLQENRDGSGTVRLASGPGDVLAVAPGYRNVPQNIQAGVALDLIPRVREAYEILQSARNAAAPK